jgi:hypothetical protein
LTALQYLDRLVDSAHLEHQTDAITPARAGIRYLVDGETGIMVHGTVPLYIK